MIDFNLEAGNIKIVLPEKKISPLTNFSFSTVLGTGAAAGFRFFPNTQDSSLLDWSIDLKFVNGSDTNVIVNQVSCEFYGKWWHLSKSRKSVFIKESAAEGSLDRHFPLMISAGSERVFHFDFILEIYQKWLFFKKVAIFKQNEIFAPETYMDLIQEIRIFVDIQGQTRPLVLKF